MTKKKVPTTETAKSSETKSSTPPPSDNGKRKKTECPLSREEFLSDAKPLALTLNGQLVSAAVREFSTGSFGWGANGKVTLMVGDCPVVVQMSCNFTLVGSKEV